MLLTRPSRMIVGGLGQTKLKISTYRACRLPLE